MKRSATAVALVAVIVTCLVLAVQVLTPAAPSATDRLPERVSSPPTDPSPSGAAPTPEARPGRATPAAAARPVRLRIPSIDVRAPVVRLGLNPDQTVEVPSNPSMTGWYQPGPAPGDLGSAVILGHVDSVRGPAVFYRLRQLERGNRIAVDAADGSTAVFRVLRTSTYANARFPAQQVYASGGGGRRLNLVTCSGRFDPQEGYQANLVVYTRQVAS